MKVDIKNNYSITYVKDKIYYTTLHLDVNDLLKEWHDDSDDSDWRPENIFELKDAILDYYMYNQAEREDLYEKEDEFVYNRDICHFEILNIESIVSELSYLINPEGKQSCCDKYLENNFRFCPDCGKELIY